MLSLGGSVFVPDNVDFKFLRDFKKLLLGINRKFIVVLGGGRTARIYINALKKGGLNNKIQSLIGIGITRMHAKFLSYYFGKLANSRIPMSMKDVRGSLGKNKVVFCGGLRYEPDNTSDGTAASLAHYFQTEFVNITNVKGLFDKDPNKFKNAKLIKKISFDDFFKMANKIKYKPGQHFVLDQNAAYLIKRYRIKTVIFGKDIKNLSSYLEGKKYLGTLIS